MTRYEPDVDKHGCPVMASDDIGDYLLRDDVLALLATPAPAEQPRLTKEQVRLLGSLLEAGDAMNRNAITDDSALYEAQKAWVCAKAAVLAEVRKQS